MKKFFLFSIATTVALSSFAQKSATTLVAHDRNTHRAAAKTTAVGDTITMSHILSTDTLTVYSVGLDSGYVTGTDAYGDKGFAERYYADTANVSVLGIISEFTGTVNPSSSKQVVFNAWSVGPKTLWAAIPSGHVYNSGFPATSLASVTKPITQLGIATVAGDPDTLKSYWFATPTAEVNKFFVGFTINYTYAGLAGDTIAVLATKQGERHIPGYTVSGTDTTIENVNVTMYDDNTWHDNGNDNFNLFNHLLLIPVLKIGSTNGVSGVTKNNLTFFGNYPNPATTATNVKFGLKNAADVTITIAAMNGAVVSTTTASYAAGTQVVELNTANLAAGEYIYVVRTSTGDAMASKMTVIK